MLKIHLEKGESIQKLFKIMLLFMYIFLNKRLQRLLGSHAQSITKELMVILEKNGYVTDKVYSELK